jgi:hypothetical protein
MAVTININGIYISPFAGSREAMIRSGETPIVKTAKVARQTEYFLLNNRKVMTKEEENKNTLAQASE